MPVTRNDILEAFHATMLAAGQANDNKLRGRVGQPRAAETQDGSMLIVFFQRHVETHHDGGTQHTMLVVGSLHAKDDESNKTLGQTELLRLSARFQAMSDAIWSAADDFAGTPFAEHDTAAIQLSIENPDGGTAGTSADGYDDEDSHARIGCCWLVKWITNPT